MSAILMRLDFFLDRLNPVEWWVGLVLLGCFGFVALAMLEFLLFDIVGRIRQRAIRREMEQIAVNSRYRERERLESIVRFPTRLH